jgi:hypothetical protein
MGTEGTVAEASRIVAAGNLTAEPLKPGVTTLLRESPVLFLTAAAKCECGEVGIITEAAGLAAAAVAVVDALDAAAVAAPLAVAGANKATRTKPTPVKATAMHTAIANSRKSHARSFLRVTVPVARPRMMRTADWLPALPPSNANRKGRIRNHTIGAQWLSLISRSCMKKNRSRN